jgi:hypothetical protein
MADLTARGGLHHAGAAMDRESLWGFAEFDQLGELYRRTLALLDVAARRDDLPDGATELIANRALPHIEDVEAGFRAWLRTDDSNLQELRTLVLQGGLALPEARDAQEQQAALAEALQARSGAGGRRELTPAQSRRLTALAHARLVFALLPRTASGDVRFPAGRRTYADIPAPRTPGELALRIEELERELWWLATGRLPRPVDGPYRRTYGFFDTAERLLSHGLRASG